MIKFLYIIDSLEKPIPNEATHLINFSFKDLKDSRLIDLSFEYDEMKDKMKKDYTLFLHQYGIRTGLLKKAPQEWWFSEFHHKDTFYDQFFWDIIKVKLVQNLNSSIHFDKIVFEKNYLTKTTITNNTLLICRTFFSRIKLLLKIFYIKFFAQNDSTKPHPEVLIYSSFPSNWAPTPSGLKERFFYTFLESEFTTSFAITVENTKSLKEAERNGIIMEQFLSLKKLLMFAFNFKLALYFFFNQKKLKDLAEFEGLSLWGKFFEYHIRSFLLNDFYFNIQVEIITSTLKHYKPKVMIIGGEFGQGAKALAIACKNTGVHSIWYQHALSSSDKLWFFNVDEEIRDGMPLPEYLFAWTEKAKIFFSEQSKFPLERIIVADSIKAVNVTPIESTLEKSKYLFAPTVSAEETDIFCYFINYLIEEKIFDGKDVILKLHPASDQFFNFNKIASKYEHLKSITVDKTAIEFAELAKETKIAVTGGTTVNLEASFYKIPVVQYLPHYKPNYTVLEKNDVTFFSNSIELKKILINVKDIKPLHAEEFIQRASNKKMLRYHEFLRKLP